MPTILDNTVLWSETISVSLVGTVLDMFACISRSKNSQYIVIMRDTYKPVSNLETSAK